MYLTGTLNWQDNAVYEKIPEYVASFDPDERDMTKYIIGTFGALDTPLNPEAKGSRRWLLIWNI